MLIVRNGKRIEIIIITCASIFFLTWQIIIHFQNCSSAPLIKNSLKLECKLEAWKTSRILGNFSEIKYKAGIST